MSDESARPDWVSVRAVAWVIDDAPVPAEVAFTLLVIARRADQNGRGSYQRTSTIAAKTGKSEKQAQRDIVRLRKLGLLLLGDQALVEKIPAGQRPVVYDLPLNLKGPKPSKASRNKSGLKADETPPMDGTSPMQGTPPMDATPTPPLQGTSTSPMHGDQKKPLNNPSEQPSSSARSPAVAYVCNRLGVDDDEAELIIQKIKDTYHPKTIGAYLRGISDDDLREVLREIRAERRTGKPDWCGRCDQHTRQIQVEGSYGHGMMPARCSRCHPDHAKPLNGQFPARDGRRVSTDLSDWGRLNEPYHNPADQDDYNAWRANHLPTQPPPTEPGHGRTPTGRKRLFPEQRPEKIDETPPPRCPEPGCSNGLIIDDDELRRCPTCPQPETETAA